MFEFHVPNTNPDEDNHNDGITLPIDSVAGHKVRPTLVIGLGGTGKKSLVQVKARMQYLYKQDVAKVFRFLCLDTDRTKTVVSQRGLPDVTLGDNELIYLGGISTGDIIDGLRGKNPHVKREHYRSWIDLSSMTRVTVSQGANGVRQIGRLCLFERINVVYNAFSSAVENLNTILTTDARLANGGQIETGKFNVFIIASTSGGTGSSMFLDIAHLIRHICKQKNINVSINGILALPDAVTTNPPHYLIANHLASMLELDHFTVVREEQQYKVDYGNPTYSFEGDTYKRPFDVCYWISGINEQGLSLGSSVSDLIAEGIRIQVAAQIGEQQTSKYDNIEQLTQGIYGANPYSSFGTAKIISQFDPIHRFFATYKLIRQLEQFVLVPPKPNETIDTNEIRIGNVFVNTLMTRVRGFQEQYDQHKMKQEIFTLEGHEVVVPKVAPSVIDNINDAARTKAVLLGRYNTVKNSWEDTQNQMLENHSTYKRTISRSFIDNIRDVLTKANIINGESSPSTSTYPLQMAIRFSEVIHDDISKEVREKRAEIQRQQEQLGNAIKAVEVALDQISKERRRDIISARANTAISKINQELAIRHDLAIHNQTVSFLDDLARFIHNNLNHLNKLRNEIANKITPLRKSYNDLAREATSSQNAFAQPLFESESLQRWYKEKLSVSPNYNLYATPVGSLVDWFVELTSNDQSQSNWDGKMNRIWEKAMRDAEKDFKFITRLSITEILNPGEITTKLTAVSRIASVALGMKAARIPSGGTYEFLDYAVGDPENSIYKNLQLIQGTEFVKNVNPHEIVVYRTLHGIPLVAINGYDYWMKVLEDRINSGNNPYIHQIDSKLRSSLATGLCFICDFLQQNNDGVYTIEHEYGTRLLGKDVKEITEFFMNDTDIRQGVIKRGEQFKQRHGEVELKNRVDGFINAHRGNNDYTRILKALEDFSNQSR